MKKNNFKAGDWVKVKALSPASFYLYKSFKEKSPFLVCPCHLKTVPIEVVEYYDNDALLCKFNDEITILYGKDAVKL